MFLERLTAIRCSEKGILTQAEQIYVVKVRHTNGQNFSKTTGPIGTEFHIQVKGLALNFVRVVPV